MVEVNGNLKGEEEGYHGVTLSKMCDYKEILTGEDGFGLTPVVGGGGALVE